MRTRGLAVLVVLAVVLVGLAVLTRRKQETRTMPSSLIGDYVFSDLRKADALNSIEKLVFQNAGATITIAKTEGAWVSPDRHGYAVEFSRVRDFIKKLSELKIGQVLPPGPEQTSALRLAAPGRGPGTGTSVVLEARGGKRVAAFILGKEHIRKRSDGPRDAGYPDGRYIAVGDSAYLVTETFPGIPEDPAAWLDKDLANVSSYDVERVTVSGPEGTRLELVRRGGGKDLAVEDLAEDEQMNASKVSGLAGVLSYLTSTDVANPSLTDEQTGMAQPLQCMVATKSGKVFTLHIGGSPEGSEDRYARLSAEYVPPPPPPVADGKTPDDTSGRDKLMAGEVRDLNQKLGGWTFLVRSYKVDDVTTDRSAFVETKEEEEPPAEAPPEETVESETSPAVDETPQEAQE
ncbi:MAG: DUF4340 domain-containing protein [Lentisphaerae bacterium]|nr:DUF4340 domain-containing protein [Lentisphaerota bacterium]